MSSLYSDPLFVRAEVAYRLERYGVGGAGTHTDAWPSPAGPWRRWRSRHRQVRPVPAPRGVPAMRHPRHP